MADGKKIAIIGGTGLYTGLEKILADRMRVDNVQTKYGPVLSYTLGRYENTRVVLLPRHGLGTKESFRTPAQLVSETGYEASIFLLHAIGVQKVYSFSAVGSCETSKGLVDDGVFIVPTTYGRGLAASQHSFGSNAKVFHPSMKEPFNKELREISLKAIKNAGFTPVDGGTYITNEGDAIETPTEVNAVMRMYYFSDKPLVLGMTAVPEAQLCAQMQIPYVAICNPVNYAEGLVNEPFDHNKVLERINKSEDSIVKICECILELT